MTNGLVSIILPVYNGSKYIKEALNSIINQSCKNWELIIVNDCSTDDTLKIVEKYAKCDDRIKIISNATNKKVAESLNIGFNAAKGEYLTWTSDDNWYKPDAIKYMADYLKQNQGIDLISCVFDMVDKDGEFIELSSNWIGKRTAAQLLYKCNVGACFMYRKKFADKVGLYDKNFFLANDYDYWMRAAIKGNIYYDESNLYAYRMHAGNLTTLKKRELVEETKRVIIKNAFNLTLALKMSKWQKINLLLELYDDEKSEIYLNVANEISPFFTKAVKFKNRFLKCVFGLKKDGKHKTFYVFGVKIKIKRER